MQTTQRPPFPAALDATILNSFRVCPRKCFLAYIENWKGQPSIDLHAGGAFARGAEVTRRSYFDSGEAAPQAIGRGVAALEEFYGDFECPEKSPKSKVRLVAALRYAFEEKWPIEKDDARPVKLASGTHAIEFNFADPLPIAHPETGDPIIYCSRTDMLADWRGGRYIWDDKTTKGIGPEWHKQWEMRGQFSGNVWGARNAGYHIDGVVAQGVAILKSESKGQRHITYRNPWEIDRWLNETYKTVRAMIQAWYNEDWDYNMGDSCAAYGGCQYLPVCKQPNPEAWLPVMFKRIRWDPLARTEIELETETA